LFETINCNISQMYSHGSEIRVMIATTSTQRMKQPTRFSNKSRLKKMKHKLSLWWNTYRSCFLTV